MWLFPNGRRATTSMQFLIFQTSEVSPEMVLHTTFPHPSMENPNACMPVRNSPQIGKTPNVRPKAPDSASCFGSVPLQFPSNTDMSVDLSLSLPPLEVLFQQDIIASSCKLLQDAIRVSMSHQHPLRQLYRVIRLPGSWQITRSIRVS